MTIPSPSQIVQLEAPVMLEDPNTQITSLEEVIKHISESMEAMKKANEDIAFRLPPRKEPRLEEKCKVKEKGKMPGGQGEEEGSVHGSHHTLALSEKSSSHKGSHRVETQTQHSDGEESRYRLSYHSRSHHSQSGKVENKKIKVNKDVQEMKEKYKKMAFFMENGEGQSTVENLVVKTNLPFTDKVMRIPLPDKFKDPWVDKYDGSGDPSDHMEGFCAHLTLRGTSDEIAC
jgi:hypothetical protein